MLTVNKCCVFFPLRPGCVTMGMVFVILSFMGALNKLMDLFIFMKSMHTRKIAMTRYQDTRADSLTEAGMIRLSLVMLIELAICAASVAFIYGILKDRMKFMVPFIVHLSLKVGYYSVYYFDKGTKEIEQNDWISATRLYIFGLIICGIFIYLWLCAYSAFLELKREKESRRPRFELDTMLIGDINHI